MSKGRREWVWSGNALLINYPDNFCSEPVLIAEDGAFAPTAEHKARIVALLNAAEPGGDIQQALDENPSPAAALRLWRLVDPAAVDRFTGAANAEG